MRRTLIVLGAEAFAAAALAALDVLPRWPGLVHAAALPPLDLAFDLRVIMARAPSYRAFGIAVACSLVARSVALAAISRMRWRRALAIESALLIPLGIASALAFSATASLYHWFAWIAIGITLVAGLAMTRSALYILALIVIGSIGWQPAVGLFVAAAAGAWLTRRKRRLRVALAVLLVLPLLPAPASAQEESVLLLVPGVDSATARGPMFDVHPRAFGFECEQTYYFSYRGLTDGEIDGPACPIRLHARYRAHDTHGSLDEAVDTLAAQVAALRPAGAPVVLVSHSQGGWIAWRAVARDRIAPPVTLVLLATHPDSPLGYPRRGRGGPGTVGADAMRLIYRLTGIAGLSSYDPDAAMARQTVARTGRVGRILHEPLPKRTKVLRIAAVIDVPLPAYGRDTSSAVIATHTGAVTNPDTAEAVRRFLAGARPKTRPADLLMRALQEAAEPFTCPPARSIRVRS